MILRCYYLAKFYGRHPEEFIKEPMSAIERHIYMTGRLIDKTAPPPEEPDG